MRRILTAVTLSVALLTAACQNPDGSTDWGSTVLLGAGVALAAVAVASATSDDDDDRRHYRRHDRRPRGHAYQQRRPGYRY